MLLNVPEKTVAGVAKVQVRSTNSSVVPAAEVHVTGDGVDKWLTLDNEGKVEWRLWGLAERVHNLTFTYVGDNTTNSSYDEAQVEVVEGLSSEMTVENREKVLTSDKVKIRVEAIDSSVVPTGDVRVTQTNGAFATTLHLKDGAVALPLTDFALGIYELEFEYLGDDNVRPTSGSTWFDMVEPGSIPVGTEMEFELHGTSPVVGGAAVTATAKFTANDGTIPAGSIQLWVSGGTGVDMKRVDSVPATGDPVTFNLPAEKVAAGRKVWAMFLPADPDAYDQSSSRQLTYSVVKAMTATSVDVPEDATAADSVWVSVKATNSSLVPTRKVHVTGDGVDKELTLTDNGAGEGVAELELDGFAAGSYELSFAYKGDDNMNGSATPDPVTVKVVKASTSLSLVPEESEAIVGGTDLVTVTATVLDGTDEPRCG